MNWLVIGGGALIVVWLLGRRVAKRDDDQSDEPIFASREGPISGVGGGDGFYGGLGGGDGGISIAGPIIAPKEDDSEPAPFGSRSLMENFVDAIGFGSLERGDEKVELPESKMVVKSVPLDMPLSAGTPRSAQIAASTSNSTAMGASTKSMSSLLSTTNNDRAVSAAVQVQPPRSFSSVAASISEQNMMPSIVAKPVEPKVETRPLAARAVAPVATKPVAITPKVETRPLAARAVAPVATKPVAVAPKVEARAVAPVAVKPVVVAPKVEARPMTVKDSFVAAIRPAAISSRPSMLTNLGVRR